jgi:DNA repair exonuclease SbcCD ATPase subunit
MIKLKQLKISGLRGVKDSLSLPLDKRSLLIYGDNGTGKSSITDAIEWFYFDKIGHLAGNEIGKDSLRNIFISDKDDSKIEFQFSDTKLDTEKSLDSSLKMFNSNSSKEFYTYISESQSENLFLRYRDLTRFVIATKGERLKELQPIIGFSQVQEMRSILKKFANKFSKEIKTANYSNKKSSQQSILMESLGQNITSENQFFEIASELILPLNLGKDIKSFKDARLILKTIETKEDTQLAEQINFNNKIADTLTELIGEVDPIKTQYKDYYSEYSNLKKDAEKFKKLQLLALLTEGLKVLKSDIINEDICPLCQQAKTKISLIAELNQRIEDLKEIKKEKENLDEKSESLKSSIQSFLNTINGLLKEKLLAVSENSEILKSVTKFKDEINTFVFELKKDIFSTDPLKQPSALIVNTNDTLELTKKSKSKAK